MRELQDKKQGWTTSGQLKHHLPKQHGIYRQNVPFLAVDSTASLTLVGLRLWFRCKCRCAHLTSMGVNCFSGSMQDGTKCQETPWGCAPCLPRAAWSCQAVPTLSRDLLARSLQRAADLCRPRINCHHPWCSFCEFSLF